MEESLAVTLPSEVNLAERARVGGLFPGLTAFGVPLYAVCVLQVSA